MTQAVTDASSGGNPDASGKKDDVVAYETYQKTVAAEKNAKAERDKLKAELEAIKQRDLEASGKHQELIENLRQQVKEKDDRLKNTESTFYAVQVQSQLKNAALKHGCEHPEKLLKLIDGKDYERLEFDKSTMSLNSQDVEILMDKLKKENEFIFKKGSARVVDGSPAANAGRANDKPKSIADIKSRLKEISVKGGR